jgi:hypothetical protein
MKEKIGVIKIFITIHEDHSIEGTVGDATLDNGTLTIDGNRFDMVAKLKGNIRTGVDFEKSYVVIFGTNPKGNEIHTDFQLKNNL